MVRVSFILPVYNVEKYVRRAIDSLLAQTMPDFEAIFVDDGSPDRSADIISEAAAHDSRLCLIRKENGGVASARNAGLDVARGKYIFFLDPDDWVEPDAAEQLADAADSEDADIVIFGSTLDTYDASGRLVGRSTAMPPLEGVFRGTPFRDNFDKIASSHLVTNKLMRREFIEQHCCRFRCYDIGEDAMFFIDFYRNDPACLVSLRKVCYHCTESRVGSLSNSYHNERIDENFYISDALRDVVHEWGLDDSPMHSAAVKYCTVRDLQMGIKNVSLSDMSLRERTAWLRRMMKLPRVREAVHDTPLASAGSRNDTVKLLLLKLHLPGMVTILSALNRRGTAGTVGTAGDTGNAGNAGNAQGDF